MSEVFDIKRFMRYTAMYYRGNGKVYLIRLAYILLGIIALCVGVTFTGSTIGGGGYNTLLKIQNQFANSYIYIGVCTLVGFVAMAMKGYNGSQFSMKDMMMPVSTFERYIFALSSIVVAAVVFNVLFWIGCSYAESLYYFSPDFEMCHYRGILGQSSLAIPEGYTQINIFTNHSTLGYFFDGTYDFNYFMACMLGYGTLGIASVIMWGMVTFKKSGELYTILLHIAIMILFGLGIFYVVSLSQFATLPTTDLYFSSPSVDISPAICHLFAIPVVAYQWVIWRKMKSFSPKN